jgi:hypothetical protein
MMLTCPTFIKLQGEKNTVAPDYADLVNLSQTAYSKSNADAQRNEAIRKGFTWIK